MSGRGMVGHARWVGRIERSNGVMRNGVGATVADVVSVAATVRMRSGGRGSVPATAGPLSDAQTAVAMACRKASTLWVSDDEATEAM